MAGNLRDALAAKRVRELVYPLAVADDTQARKRLEEARARRVLAGVGKTVDEEDVKAAQAAEDQAQAEVDACYYQLRLRGVSAADMEALRASCPPPPDADEDVTFDVEAFRPALVAACAVDSDLSAEEWAAELASDRWTVSDVASLYQSALIACNRPVNDGLGKG